MSAVNTTCKHDGLDIEESSDMRDPNRWVHTDTDIAACVPTLLFAEPDVDKLLTDAVAALDESYTLTYVSQGDRFTDAQIVALLEDSSPFESKAFADFEEYESDNRYEGAMAVITELLTDEQIEVLKDAGLIDNLRFEVYDRDNSSVYDDLLRGTPDQLFRYDLGVDVPDYTQVQHNTDRLEVLAEIAEAAGLDISNAETRKTLDLLLTEASYGGRLYALWYGDVETAINLATAPQTETGEDIMANRGTVTFMPGHLLILNSQNGSGMHAEVPTISAVWAPKCVELDAARIGPGYSWTDTASPVRSAYASTVTTNEVAS